MQINVMMCRFWTYPHALRYRVAQILVLPWCQGQGIGGELLRALNSVRSSILPCMSKRPTSGH